ncbi:hypothetical protein F8568_021670 [Actinomadura sp. LD22]|uniref:WD40 repeat domain-containing protein n=1 Tax=Actinomadura physcomitrii TaxID=2650748 RepID=A0A6I4M9P7_9ACTN|nr:hypothetical protein [Actinomadura physcomitrii]MWA02938.1 hypothetical protein [Actinomadura physcomitrii]
MTALQDVVRIAGTPSHPWHDRARTSIAAWLVEGPRRDSPLVEVVLRNDEAPPSPALDALWAEWLASPTEPLVEALLRWGLPATDPEHGPFSVIALAAGPDALGDPSHRQALQQALRLSGHPLALMTAEKIIALDDPGLVDEVCEATPANPDLAPVCAEHGLAPVAPVRRALFYLVTRQFERYRALDRDGSLLALAYAGATDVERVHAREAMLIAGGLDPVRVIVGEDRRAGLAELSDEEVRWLAEQLADRRAWEELWAFVLDLPITTCVELVRLFDPRWAPRDDKRHLYTSLREALPQNVRAGMRRIRERAPATTWWVGPLTPGAPALSFAPDGPFLAVGGYDARVYDLRTELQIEYYSLRMPVERLLHIGGGTLIAAEFDVFPMDEPDRYRLVRCSQGRWEELLTTSTPVSSLQLTGHDGSFAAATGNRLLRGGRSGDLDMRALSSYIPHRGRSAVGPRLAAHRDSGRLAVLESTIVLIDGSTGDFTTVGPATPLWRAQFLDADTLVGDVQRRVARVSLPDGRLRSEYPGLADAREAKFLVLPRTGHVVVAGYGDEIKVSDGERTESFSTHRPSERRHIACLAVSPGGDFVAVGFINGDIDIYHVPLWEAGALFERPMAGLTPRDLGFVSELLASPVVHRDVRFALEPLKACLEHRFRSGVGAPEDG